MNPEIELKSVAPFSALAPAALADLVEAARVVHFASGADLVREGERGRDLYVLLAGTADVYAAGPGGEQVLLAVLGPRQMVGEMSALTDAPRSATVTARESVVALEIGGTALDWHRRRDPAFAVALEAIRARHSTDHLFKTSPLFASTAPQKRQDLAARAAARLFQAGEVVCREGEAGDALFMVQSGFVKVTRRGRRPLGPTGNDGPPGLEQVVGYHGAGSFFGEMAVVSGAPRTATVTAFTTAQIVVLPADAVELLLADAPEVSRALSAAATTRTEATRDVEADPAQAELLEKAVDLGLVAADRLMVIDLGTCFGCDACVAACEDRHGEKRLDRAGDTVAHISVPVACRLCPDPVCLLCPYDGIRRDPTGEIYITDSCIGCTGCARRCPYDVITIRATSHPRPGPQPGPNSKPRAVKCDHCRGYANKACVDNCPVGAIGWVDPAALFATPNALRWPTASGRNATAWSVGTLALAAAGIGLLGAVALTGTDGGVRMAPRSLELATGWLAATLGAAGVAYAWRRRVRPSAPGRLDTWLRLHVLLSLIFAPAALIHATLASRHGLATVGVGLGSAALVAGLAVVASGLLGSALHRRAPARLARRRQEHSADIALLDDQIDGLRRGRSAAFARSMAAYPGDKAPGEVLGGQEGADLAMVRRLQARRDALQAASVDQGEEGPAFRGFRWWHVALSVVLVLATAGHAVDTWRPIRPAARGAGAAAAYPSAAECAACHEEVVAEWRASPHARAATSPLTMAMNDADNQGANATCLGCHAPVAAQLGLARPASPWLAAVRLQAAQEGGGSPARVGQDPGAAGGRVARTGEAWRGLPPATFEGVTCVVCHGRPHAGANADVVVGTTRPPFPVPAFDVAFGGYGGGARGDPRPLRNTAHRSQFDAAVSSPGLCRPCHDVTLVRQDAAGRPARVRLQETYSEWLLSGEAASCQDCHMPAVAPSRQAGGPAAREGRRHEFAAVDTAFWRPGTSGRGRGQPEQGTSVGGAAVPAPAALAAAVEMTVTATVGPLGRVTATVAITNVGAGHELPTGFTFERELWLAVGAFDAAGDVVFASGTTDELGRLFDERHPDVQADPGAADRWLTNLRGRLVRLDEPRTDWVTDQALAVPDRVLDSLRNRNGTLVLDQSRGTGQEAARGKVVHGGDSGAVRARSGAASDGAGLREVYLQTEADGVLKEGLAAGEARIARYPLPASARSLRVRLLMRPLPSAVVADVLALPHLVPAIPVFELAAAAVDITPRR